MTFKATAVLAAAVAALAPPARAQSVPSPLERDLLARLEREIAAIDGRVDGVLGVAVVEMGSSVPSIAVRGDRSFPQASAIKLALLYELYQQVHQGRVNLDELATIPAPEVRAGGSGILPLLSRAARLTIRDHAVLMMALSDNASTNVLVDRVTLDAVNARMDALGLRATRFRRRMIDLEAAKRGDENVSTPIEMARLTAFLHRGDGLSPELRADMIAVASVPKGNPLREALPPSVRGIDKPGGLEAVRTAAGFVALQRRSYGLSICLTALGDEATGDPTIREISRLVYETYDRLDRMEPTGRLIRRR